MVQKCRKKLAFLEKDSCVYYVTQNGWLVLFTVNDFEYIGLHLTLNDNPKSGFKISRSSPENSPN